MTTEPEVPRRRGSGFVLVVALLVLVSRLPFLTPGYGADPDAWRLATAARDIAHTGQYHESRAPGHPVQEWVSSWLWRGGPTAVNGATAVMSAVMVFFFGLVLVELGGGPWAGLAALAFGFTPVVFIHSVDAMDYVWALALSMVALWLTLRRSLWWAGIALGLAVGCRITAALLFVPLAVLAWSPADRRTRSLVALGAPAAALGLALYLPNFLQRGIGFLHFAEGRFPAWTRIAQDLTIEIWGTLGSLVPALAIVVTLIRIAARGEPPRSAIQLTPSMDLACLATIALYGLAFLRLPADPAYLLPAIPFVLLLLAGWLSSRAFLLVCLGLVLSPAVLDLGRGEDRFVVRVSEGPVLVDHHDRVADMNESARILAAARRLPARATVVVSSRLPQLELLGAGRTGARLVYTLRASAVDSLARAGGPIYFAPGSDADNLRYEGVDLKAFGALPLPLEGVP